MHATYTQYTTWLKRVMETTKQCIYRFCEEKVYPSGLTKNEKRAFRRKCQVSFTVKNGQLYHRQFNRGKSSEQAEDNWKLCIKNREEKDRVDTLCQHAGGVKTTTKNILWHEVWLGNKMKVYLTKLYYSPILIQAMVLVIKGQFNLEEASAYAAYDNKVLPCLL